ncbi:MAG TPA: pseudouridine synthase [Polyangiaceae bacterium]|nr:pseudouridine synthase [Polyangiaceae bacterium]
MSSIRTPEPSAPRAQAPLEILYEDEDLVIVNKPSGLLVHRGLAQDADTALFRVRDHFRQRVYPAHRLDRGTSGALLFARHPTAMSSLGKLFECGAVEKSYWALVRGRPPESGIIDHPVPRAEGAERVPAVTRFRLLATSPRERCSLVEALPVTGRFHQIRRHLSHIHHPLVGDVNYGRGDINRKYRAEYGFHRLGLHAHRLAFTHPLRALNIVVEAPLDPEFARVLDELQLSFR